MIFSSFFLSFSFFTLFGTYLGHFLFSLFSLSFLLSDHSINSQVSQQITQQIAQSTSQQPTIDPNNQSLPESIIVRINYVQFPFSFSFFFSYLLPSLFSLNSTQVLKPTNKSPFCSLLLLHNCCSDEKKMLYHDTVSLQCVVSSQMVPYKFSFLSLLYPLSSFPSFNLKNVFEKPKELHFSLKHIPLPPPSSYHTHSQLEHWHKRT